MRRPYPMFVLIDGVGLAGATVTFGAAGAAIVSNTGTRMVVQVPPSLPLGLLVVTVTTAGGSGTASFSVTGAAPTVVVTDVTPSSGAAGDCFGVDGVNLWGPFAPTVVRINGTAATVTSSTPLGGVVSSTLLTLVVLPAVYALFVARGPVAPAPASPADGGEAPE